MVNLTTPDVNGYLSVNLTRNVVASIYVVADEYLAVGCSTVTTYGEGCRTLNVTHHAACKDVVNAGRGYVYFCVALNVGIERATEHTADEWVATDINLCIAAHLTVVATTDNVHDSLL